jgi:hypothetical protein
MLRLENDAAAAEPVAATGEADAAAGEAGVAPGVVVINTASPKVAGEVRMSVLSPVVAPPLSPGLPPPPSPSVPGSHPIASLAMMDRNLSG